MNVWMVGVEVVVGDLYPSTTKQPLGLGCCRWAHRTVWCATGHCPVRQPRHPTVRVRAQSTVGALSSCGTGQALFTVRCTSGDCSDFCVHCSSLFTECNTLKFNPVKMRKSSPVFFKSKHLSLKIFIISKLLLSKLIFFLLK
jgi:hypothetical protein